MLKPLSLDQSLLSESFRQFNSALKNEISTAITSLIDKTCLGREFTGWFDYPRIKGLQLADEISSWQALLKCDFDSVVLVGIGGSYLGTRCVYEAFGLPRRQGAEKKEMFFAGHHLSGLETSCLLESLKGKKPLVVVVSKSGTTTEPAVAFRLLRAYLEQNFSKDEVKKRIVAVTDPKKGALKTMAVEEGWVSFEVPPDIGGRFSVLTAVGLVPLSLAGVDIRALLRGADFEFQNFLKEKEKSAAATYAGIRRLAVTGGKTVEILASAEPSLAMLAEWWKQLFGESEGKQGKGLLPVSVSYTTDLHSLGQYVQDGQRLFFETFLEFSEQQGLAVPPSANDLDELAYLEGRKMDEINRNAMLATKIAHRDGGVPCLTVQAENLSITTYGQLFAFFETSCALSAALLGVNPFDQPGVEQYKKEMFRLLGKP